MSGGGGVRSPEAQNNQVRVQGWGTGALHKLPRILEGHLG